MSPKISVIVPCYNYGEFIEETITSINSQTFKDYEIIVVDDGSDDIYTHEILSKIENNGILVIRKENGGISSARNIGIQHASGEFIVPLDSDDIIRPEFLEECIALFKRDETVTVAYTGVEFFGASTGIMELKPPTPQNMVFRNCLVVTAMYRKKEWEQAGGYKSSMKFGYEDWDFWICLLEKGAIFKKVEKPLFLYRIKKASRNVGIFSDQTRFLSTMEQIINNHASFFHRNSTHLMNHIRREKTPWIFDILELFYLNDKFQLTTEDNLFIKMWKRYYDFQEDSSFKIKFIPFLFTQLNGVSTTRKITIFHKYVTSKFAILSLMRRWIRNIKSKACR